MQNQPCPICTTPCQSFFRSKLGFSIRSDWTPLHLRTHLYFCKNCQHLFKPDDLVLQGSDYNSYSMWDNSLQGDKIVFEGGNPTVGRSLKIISYLSEKYPKTKHILDYGCNRGAFLQHLQTKGHAGFDVSEQYRKNIEDLGFDYYSTYDFPHNNFDVVTLIHVYEHLLQLQKDMLPATKALAKKGKVFIQIPNIQLIA